VALTHPWLQKLPRPAVIAHRGASLDAPENTLAAFELAVEFGADAIELDVKLCASGEPVVIHDRSVGRTSNGTGEVSSLPLSVLKTLDAGSWFDAEFAGEGLPTLDDVFRRVGREILINVELTNYQRPLDGLPDAVAEVVRSRGMETRVWFSSFNPFSLRRIRRLLPEAPVGLLLTRGGEQAVVRRLASWITPYDAVHPEYSELSESYIHRLQRKGLPVYTYTVNDPAEIRRVVRIGVEGVITDDPTLARRVVRSLADADEMAEN
jgi:glycerophosphoryl diester phosphodiesterase